MNNKETIKPKIATAGKLEIAINHFTTDITQLPYWMDSNCYIVFSLLWRRYISASINEKLITPDGWFQYTMKSLMIHCGFKDKGTLQRAVEGLFRSGLIDVRVEAGSRLWACWKMNKKNIEYVASIPDRDAMQEPFLNSITTISSKDKNFTYQLNKDGIEGLMKFFMINPVENPPLFNTIKQQYNITKSQNDFITIPLEYNITKKQDNLSTIQSEDKVDEEIDIKDLVNNKKDLEKEMEAPAEHDTNSNIDIGDSELRSKNEMEAEEDPNGYQSMNNNLSGGSQGLIPIGLQAEKSGEDYLSQSQLKDKGTMQQGDASSSKPQLTENEELEQWKQLVDPELKGMKYAASLEDMNQMEKKFYQSYYKKVTENGFINEGVSKLLDSYIEDLLSTWRYHAIIRGNRMQSSS